MKIVLLNQYFLPDEAATAQLLADLGAALVDRGHRVVAVASDRSYADPSRRYRLRETTRALEIRRVRTTGFGRARRAGRIVDYGTFLAGAALELLRIPRPDLVVSLSTPPLVATLGFALARAKGARTVYWVMDIYPDLAVELGAIRRGSMTARVLGAVGRRLLQRSDQVIGLDRAMAERLEAHGAARVVVIPNWADEDAIRPIPAEGHPLRRQWGWDGRFVVLYSGNMGMAHEFETLLDAVERIGPDADIVFAFIGGGPRRADIEAECARRRLTNVEFRPYVPRESLGASLTAGDLHVVTLRPGVEGLVVPSKIYGILAAGRPTLYLGPPRGEVHEIVTRGCGVSLRNGDAGAAAEAILRYRDDRARAQRDGAAGRRLFEERYTRSSSLEAFVTLVESIGGSRGNAEARGDGVA